ncbi:hypothetical protein [Chromobacterium violaceum]|uniref:hypothetical protein n=1 Tax=Chromobacterium violaceum TaxID=536 RepID=UPI001CE0C5A1|nr:hypothetical protein [Chromobacterium violaceum]
MAPQQQWMKDEYLHSHIISYVCDLIEGYQLGIRKAALAMLKSGMDRALIIEYTGLSEKELDWLAQEDS